MKAQLQVVSGWGGTPKARTRLLQASDPETIGEVIVRQGRDSRGLIARGLGRSYGDASQRSGGTTLVIGAHERPVWINLKNGVVRAPAGTSIGDLIRFVDAHDYFVPVTPGTRYVTVGGAIAADVHGKDHHATGSLGKHVSSFRLMLATGEVVDVDRTSDPALFDATIGGMGLTGVILDADLNMIQVPGNRLLVDTFSTSDLDTTMTALEESEGTHRYSVAWVDLVMRGARLGRGVVTNGNHTDVRQDPLRDPILTVPPMPTSSAVNRLSVRVFNELWFRKTPTGLRQDVQGYNEFFYPLDTVRRLNRLYGRRGFLQYQFVVPFGSESVLPKLVEALAESPSPVSLAVLKRFGQASGGYLSFPISGWTLAADIPIPRSPHELEAVLRPMDETLAESGGRVYLAKDSRLGADLFATMYPEIGGFLEVRERVDPRKVFLSDLALRMGL